MSESLLYIAPPYQPVAQAFHDGMLQEMLEAEDIFKKPALAEFKQRGLGALAERSFNFKHLVSKLPSLQTPDHTASHTVTRFRLEYFCCLSALNLYRARAELESFCYDHLVVRLEEWLVETEDEWLELSGQHTPEFRLETGYERGYWRRDVIRAYLRTLEERSSRDSDTLVTVRRFLARHGLAAEAGVAISPALLQACADLLDKRSNWLVRYLTHVAAKKSAAP